MEISKEPAISVAMATYNGERFLREQLDSLARQTLLPCELIVRDDGSTDGTLNIVRRFAAISPFPVRIQQNEKRLGHGLNFLRSASQCAGSLIAFSDQDDVWVEHKLQRCAGVVAETGSVLVIHSGQVTDENLRPLGRQTPSSRRLTRLDSASGKGWHPLEHRLGMSPGFACVFGSELLRQIPPVPPLSGSGKNHEQWLLFAAEVAGSITLIPDELVLYRQHSRNTMGFHARHDGGQWEFVDVGGTCYKRQAEASAARARLLADAASRTPGLRCRFARAQGWYEARSKSLARRAELYAAGPSIPAVTRRLFSMIFSGTYRAVPQGGLGLRGLSKDLVMPLLQRTVKKPQDSSELPQRFGQQSDA